MAAHIAKVLEGEYDCATEFNRSIVVVDVGANVGAFTIWARQRWNVEMAYCYEPTPETFAMLDANLDAHGGACDAIQAAVDAKAGRIRMYRGKTNPGENSLYRREEQSADSFDVETVAASSLPKCDLLKIDAEGAEDVILAGYKHLPIVSLVLLEWHGEEKRRFVDDYLARRGFVLAMSRCDKPYRGVVGYVPRGSVR